MMKFPSSLKSGDKIAIVSPASVVKEEYVTGAAEQIAARGYLPVVMPHAVGYESGSYSATRSNRIIDLLDAVTDPDIKAILCARGGYGCCQLLDALSPSLIASNPKWIVGFSDVSALLALWLRSGLVSVHGPMAKHLATMPDDDFCTRSLFHMLENGGSVDYKVEGHAYNRYGTARGCLKGGNFAVLTDLADTPYDILSSNEENEDVILFLEDIAEPIYKVNRMLWRLLLSGALDKVKGIIFGAFTEYRPDRNFETMEDMIHDFLERHVSRDIPVVYDFPTGHIDRNLPLPVGAGVELKVDETGVRLTTLDPVSRF